MKCRKKLEKTQMNLLQNWVFQEYRVTCWLRWHLGFSREFPKFTWILGVSPGVSHPSISYVLSHDPDWQDETSGSHSWFLAHRREHALIELVVFFPLIFDFITFSHLSTHPRVYKYCAIRLAHFRACVLCYYVFFRVFINMILVGWQYGRRFERKNYYLFILDYSYALHGI